MCAVDVRRAAVGTDRLVLRGPQAGIVAESGVRWIFLPMVTALLFIVPMIGLVLWQTRARES